MFQVPNLKFIVMSAPEKTMIHDIFSMHGTSLNLIDFDIDMKNRCPVDNEQDSDKSSHGAFCKHS